MELYYSHTCLLHQAGREQQGARGLGGAWLGLAGVGGVGNDTEAVGMRQKERPGLGGGGSR